MGAPGDSPGPPPVEPSYRAPFAFDDPDDPFQAVRWTSGLYVPARFQLGSGDRGLRVTVEYDLAGDRILLVRKIGGKEAHPPLALPREEFAAYATRTQLRRGWSDITSRATNVARNTQEGGLLDLSLPFEVPFTEKLFGRGAPNLKVSGSERITLSGTSSWTVGQKDTERGRSSIFPKLDMRQQLNVNLRGTIGTKLFVDVQQNSEALTPLENAIKIRYKGEEDEILQTVELGNTNLSLPATQYVSFSARQEGLFGVKATAKVGDIGITAIASRQEGEGGQSTLVGGSQEQRQVIRDIDAIRGKYFFLSDPDSSQFPILVPGSVRVFLDDRNKLNDKELNAIDSRIFLDPRCPDAGPVSAGGKFHELDQELDFTVYNEKAFSLPLLRLKNPLSDDYTLAVAYRELGTQIVGGVRQVIPGDTLDVGTFVFTEQDTTFNLKMLRPALDLWGDEDLSRSAWGPVRRLELKNFYSLRSRNIDRSSFDLQITLNGGNNEAFLTNYEGRQVPLIEILGLDQRNNETGTFNPDGRVDDEWIVYEEGLLFFPDLRPFDPLESDFAGTGPYSELSCFGRQELRGRSRSWPVNQAARPDTLGWEGGGVRADPEARQDETTPELYDLRIDRLRALAPSKFNLEATFKTTVSTLQLSNVGRIIEGSETVRLNGEILSRGTDYRIVYETGEIELLNPDATAPGADLVVTYSYDSPFSRGSRSLLGASLAYEGDASYRYSTSWLRESRGVPELRPRLGQEPTTTTVGDFSGDLRLQPWGLTRLMDGLPLIHTTVPSQLTLSAALGLSFPDPNTRGQVYIDDMEGAESVTFAPLSRRSWFYSSVPFKYAKLTGPDAGMEVSPAETARGKLLWFSPSTVREQDLRPNLEEFEANNFVPVLDVVYVPNPAAPVDDAWGGLISGLGRTGANVAQAQFVEVWVNDFVPYEDRENAFAGRRGELRVDIGSISEDAVWDPRVPPLPANRVFDFEDQNENGGLIEADEDVGLDLTPDSGEVYDPDRPGGNPSGDKAGDNRRAEVGEPDRADRAADKIRKFDGINGTEDNDDPDTEDANLNDRFDLENDYYEYAIDLASEAFLDVTRDFTNVRERARNGWRLYRIPLNDPGRLQVGSPDLTTVKHIRVWFRGVDPGDTLNVQIAGIEVVGNRWERLPVRDGAGQEIPEAELSAQGSVFTMAVVNNKDNQNEYTPPFQVERRDRVTEREQSLSLEFENLKTGYEGRAFRSFLEPRDFTLYRELSFYLQPKLDLADSVEFFVRFSSNASTDTLTYYEIATPLTELDERRRDDGWIDLRLDLSLLSGIKVGIPSGTAADSFLVGPDDVVSPQYGTPPRVVLDGDLRVTVRGQPSFSQIRRMSVGLRNRSGQDAGAGRVWFNELRIGDVRRDNGWIGRASATVTLADVASFNVQASMTDEDFVRLGQTRGSGTRDETYLFGTQVNAHKLFEGTGFNVPIKYNTTRTTRTPKFFANSDVEFTGTNTGRDITESGQDNLTLALSRVPRGRSPFYLRYTLDMLRVNAQVSNAFSTNPTGVDTTARRQVGVNYSLAPGVRPFRLLGQLEFSPLPRTVGINWNRSRSERRQYARDRLDPTVLRPTNLDTTLTGTLDFSTTFNPISPLTYSYSSSRDLIDDHFENEIVRRERPARSLFGLDIGREVSQTQAVNVNYTPPLLGVLRPRLTWSGNFNASQAPTLTRADYSAAVRNIGNGNNLTVNFRVPLGEWSRSLFPPAGDAPTPGGTPGEREQADRRRPGERGGPSPADSAGAAEPQKKGEGPGLGFFFNKVVRFGDIQASGGITRRSTITGVNGSPDLLYQLGISDEPGFGDGITEVTDLNGTSITQRSEGRGNNVRGSSQLTLLNKLQLDLNFQKRIDRSSTGGGTTNSVRDDTTWPEVRVDWGDIHRSLPLVGSLLSDFRAVSSSYSRTTAKSGTEANPEQQVTVSTNWRPLIRLDGTLPGGWKSRLGIDLSSTETSARRPGIPTNINKRGTTTVSTAFSKTFLRKGKDGANRNIDYSVDVSYSRNDSRTVDADGNVRQSRTTDNVQIRNQATLRFTRTISGTFGLNLGQQRDVSADRTTRSIGISFATGFNF